MFTLKITFDFTSVIYIHLSFRELDREHDCASRDLNLIGPEITFNLLQRVKETLFRLKWIVLLPFLLLFKINFLSVD